MFVEIKQQHKTGSTYKVSTEIYISNTIDYKITT